MQIVSTMSDDNTSGSVELSAEALASVSGGRTSDRLSRRTRMPARAKKRARRRYGDLGIGEHSMRLGWGLGSGS
jgi:hypothetical protein